jgi:hypothetical protein
MLAPMLMGFTIPGYSSLSQQLSELELLHHPAAQATRIAAIVCGASIILFSLALMQRGLRQYLFTSFSALIFGASMVRNGSFVMGSPLHGLYGIGFFVVLVPPSSPRSSRPPHTPARFEPYPWPSPSTTCSTCGS